MLDFDNVATAMTEEARSPLDLDVVRHQFEEYRDEAKRIEAETKALTVKDDESLNIAIILGGNAKKIIKSIELQRKQVIAEPQDFIRGVNAICKAITDGLDKAESTAKVKIGQYQARVEMERREREKKAREEAAKLQEAVNRESKEKGIEAPVVVTPVVQEKPRVTRTEAGSAYQVKRTVCRIVNPDEVPREYCEPVQRLLDNAVKMGCREIKGCVIEEITETRFRT
jgi:hypothetical protein